MPHRTTLQPIYNIQIRVEDSFMEANMLPNDSRKVAIMNTMEESFIIKTTTKTSS